MIKLKNIKLNLVMVLCCLAMTGAANADGNKLGSNGDRSYLHTREGEGLARDASAGNSICIHCNTSWSVREAVCYVRWQEGTPVVKYFPSYNSSGLVEMGPSYHTNQREDWYYIKMRAAYYARGLLPLALLDDPETIEDGCR